LGSDQTTIERVGARATLASHGTSSMVPIDVVLFATLSDGRRIDTTGQDGTLGVDVQRTKQMAVRVDEPAPDAPPRVTLEDVERIVSGVARGNLDLLETALHDAGVAAAGLDRVPLVAEIDPKLAATLRSGR
jgi:hypothetical protein